MALPKNLRSGLVLESTTNDSDYLLGGSQVPALPVLKKTYDVQYNQNEIDKCSCFLLSFVGAASDQTGYRFSKADISEMFQALKDEGKFIPGVGGRFADGADAVRRWWNSKNPLRPMTTFRMEYGTSGFASAVVAGYSVVTGISVDQEFVKDSQDDGKVNGVSFEKKWNHAVRSRGAEIVDNYLGVLKRNVYSLAKPEELLKNGNVIVPCFGLVVQDKAIFPDVPSGSDFFEAAKFAFENGLTARKEGENFEPNRPISRGEAYALALRLSKLKPAA